MGLFANGDKQALLARILNEENSLTTDSQVKDSDTDQEMLRTFRGTPQVLFSLLEGLSQRRQMMDGIIKHPSSA